MTTCREEALRWVHRYAVGGAAFAAIPLPGTSTGLATLETHLTSVIGEIYGESVGTIAATAAGGSYAIMGQGLKYLVRQAAIFVPGPAGFALRLLVAAATIEGIGRAIIEHYERKYPGKLFQKVS